MGDGINFSSLARTFWIKDGDGNVPKNGGQIVQQYLEDNGIVYVNSKGKNDGIKCRRKKRKIDGTD